MTERVESWFSSFTQEALAMTDGDLQKVDFLQDSSWYEYFYRRRQLSAFQEKRAEALKNRKSK